MIASADLFTLAPTAPSSGAVQAQPGDMPPSGVGGRTVTINCCDKRYTAFLNHYDVAQTPCGCFWWAIQRKQGQPLVASPWPGNMAMKPDGTQRMYRPDGSFIP